MPELPDVEVYKKYFDKYTISKSIKAVEVKDHKVVKTSEEQLNQELRDRSFQKSRRWGKYLLAEFDEHKWLLLHFGMTGALNYFNDSSEAPKYGRVLFHFNNNHSLAFINKRKFGYVDLIYDLESFKKNKKLGQDALDFELDEFKDIISNRKRSKIKAVLMDQKKIAGLGNVYTDEILYQTKIHPEEYVTRLQPKDIERIYNTMNRVLHTTINHQADPKDLPDSYLTPHRQKGASCPKCSGKIKRISSAGRSSYICKACQQLR